MKTKKKCLIVDDDQIYLKYLRYFLEYNGLEAISAFRVDQALDILKKEKIELIITDIHMPIRNGFDLLKELKHLPISEKIPVLVVSDNNDYAVIKKALELGANGFIQKPLLKIHMDKVFGLLKG